MTGRAIAGNWQGAAHVGVYMVLLAAATRFFHFALFSGTLLSPYYYLVDLVVLLAIAALGFRITRGKQMERQYGFLSRQQSADAGKE
jgi:protein-S-isoprenylcysteine O-methyltransferase Ste14